MLAQASPALPVGERVVIEQPEPVVDSVLGHRVHLDVGDLGQSLCPPGESFGRLAVVAGVVPDRLLGIRPGVAVLAVGDESADKRVRIVRLDLRITCEAFDPHELPSRFMGFSPSAQTRGHVEHSCSSTRLAPTGQDGAHRCVTEHLVGTVDPEDPNR
jgi:hypothetical protein